MEIRRTSPDTEIGPSNWFTGVAYMNNLKRPSASNHLAIGSVTFTPGARTFWHSHPYGQTLIVTEGVGVVGRRNGPPEEIRPGDVVVIEPNEHHWHGACANVLMTHIHINEVSEDGTYATFYEEVTNSDYVS